MIVTRMARKLVLLVACCVVSAHAFASFSDSGTLTGGFFKLCSGGTPTDLIDTVGFDSGVVNTYGTYSPAGLAGGERVAAIYDQIRFTPGVCSQQLGTGARLAVAGFPSNPGGVWLISISCGATQLSGASASTFSYNNGIASWAWSNQLDIGSDRQASCTLVHN